jgi:membrane protein
MVGRAATAGRTPRRDRRPLERLQSFFTEQIWGAQTAGSRRGQAILYRLSRLAYSTVRGFFENRLTVRAAALSYFSVLSIVPFLAFAFAVLKGFGAYASFIEGTVRPYLRQTFSANPELLDSINRILHFVDRTDVSKLGTLGMLFLVYTSVSLLSSVEQALNEIWGAKTTRPFVRQVTDYVTLLVTTPLLILVAATFATAAQSSDAVRFLRQSLGLGPVIDFLLRFTSVLVVGVALFALYTILPNVRTRLRSALVGAAVAALAWQGALVLHVQFQMGVAKYNALYSVLSALPIFLVWTYASWLIVLVGAQVAASHQNEQMTRQRLHAQRADQALKETLAVAAAAQVARDFLAAGPRRSHEDLAALFEVPPPAMEEILEALVRAGLLARSVSGHEIAYLPGRDPDTIHFEDLRDALRREKQADVIREDVERQIAPGLREILDAAEERDRGSPQNLTLRELALLLLGRDGEEPAERPQAPARAEANGKAVLDPKQPDVPA